MLTKTTIAGASGVVLLLVAAVLAQGTHSTPTLTSVAYRLHRVDAMEKFYAEAFGVRFRDADTGGLRSRFGDVGPITLKFVPIREKVEFEAFPIHQVGFEVPDVSRVLEIAKRHGGRVQDAPVRDGGRVHASVRDPDGNTVELSGPR